jgi:hypothetical protein
MLRTTDQKPPDSSARESRRSADAKARDDQDQRRHDDRDHRHAGEKLPVDDRIPVDRLRDQLAQRPSGPLPVDGIEAEDDPIRVPGGRSAGRTKKLSRRGEEAGRRNQAWRPLSSSCIPMPTIDAI